MEKKMRNLNRVANFTREMNRIANEKYEGSEFDAFKDGVIETLRNINYLSTNSYDDGIELTDDDFEEEKNEEEYGFSEPYCDYLYEEDKGDYNYNYIDVRFTYNGKRYYYKYDIDGFWEHEDDADLFDDEKYAWGSSLLLHAESLRNNFVINKFLSKVKDVEGTTDTLITLVAKLYEVYCERYDDEISIGHYAENSLCDLLLSLSGKQNYSD